MTQTPRRILIDADWSANGIWWVLTAEEMTAPAPSGHWSGTPQTAAPPEQSGGAPKQGLLRLSPDLRDALKRWNDEMMKDLPQGAGSGSSIEERGRLLAHRVQQELGKGFEVLYRVRDRIYRVDPPGNWGVKTWHQELLGYPPQQPQH